MGYETGEAMERLADQRDDLAAELERVKAEMYEIAKMSEDRRVALNASIKLRALLLEDADELKSLKSRLPVNADGNVVLWGDEVWMWDAATKKPVRGFVETIIEADEEHEFMGDMPEEKIPFTTPDWCCHSTAESCRAANEKGENDGE